MRYKRFCAIEALHRKVCWLTCCVRKDRRLNTDLRFALAPKLVPVAGPTVTYGPYCQSQGARGSQTLAIFFEQVSRLLCCAYARYSTENKGLLTEQALLLSKESLLRQQAFGPSCANALVLCLLLH